MKNLKTLLVRAMLGSDDHAELMAEIKAMKPHTAKPEVKKACDAALVHAQAAKYHFEVTEEGRKFPSGLTIGLPEKPTAKQTAKYKAAKRMLSYYRTMLLRPKKAEPMNHGDIKKRDAARIVKVYRSERALEAFFNECRRQAGYSV